MYTTYNDLYDYDWNLDGTVTRIICNKQYRIGVDFVRDDQYDLLKNYKDKHEEDKRLFLQFMEHNNSPSLPLNKKYLQRKRNKLIFWLIIIQVKQMLELLANHQKITKLFALMMNL